MTRPASLAAAAMLCAVTMVAGCGEDEGDPESEPTSGGSASPDVAADVVLALAEGAGGTTLSATNESDAEALVLLPVGEPEQVQASEGDTLTYVRPESGSSGEEPDLYEAIAVPAGETRQLDASTIGEWTTPVQVCLEVVPAGDVAVPAEQGVAKVDGGDGAAEPTVACSGFGSIE